MINDEKIDNEFIVDNLPRIYQLSETHQIENTFFEYITALSLLYFKEKKVEFVSWETGLGGRLDSTNCIENTMISVITTIGYDHQ
jgi:dihydrofolate synthase/folylpolyglutamate synthase